MTLFEYLSVLASIILSLSAAQLLTQVRSVLNPKKQYWIHSLWVFFVLLLHLLIWWEFWGYRDVVSWNIINFGLLLTNPVILFVCSSALVHSDSNEIENWLEHFYEARKTIFITLGLLPIASVLRRLILSDLPILRLQNLPELFFALLFLAGFLHAGKRVHAAIVIASWLLVLYVTVSVWYQPGAVVNPPQ
jgi:hypothetical protein